MTTQIHWHFPDFRPFPWPYPNSQTFPGFRNSRIVVTMWQDKSQVCIYLSIPVASPWRAECHRTGRYSTRPIRPWSQYSLKCSSNICADTDRKSLTVQIQDSITQIHKLAIISNLLLWLWWWLLLLILLLKLFTATAIYNKPEWPGITLSIKYWHKK